jgi:hypothetical protein
MFGNDGRESCPVAVTSTSASISSPPTSRTSQWPRSSSKSADATSVAKRMCSRSPYLSVTRSR